MNDRVEGEIVIHRPVEEVFDFVADERNEPRYNPRMLHVEQTSARPVGLGARFSAEMRSTVRTVRMTIENTGYERPRRLAVRTHLSNTDIEGNLRFEPLADGTRMRWRWDLEPRRVLRLMTPLTIRMGQRQEQAIWSSLKRALEAHGSEMR